MNLEEWKRLELMKIPANKKNAISRIEEKLKAIEKDVKPAKAPTTWNPHLKK